VHGKPATQADRPTDQSDSSGRGRAVRSEWT